MPTIQDQYTEFAQRGQEAVTAVVEAWTSSVQQAATRVPAALNPASANAAVSQAIDEAFDFATKVIDVQRSFIKQAVTTATAAAEDVVQRATVATNEAREAGTAAFDTAVKTGLGKKTGE